MKWDPKSGKKNCYQVHYLWENSKIWILDKSIISKLNFLNCIVVMKRNGGRGVTGHGTCNSFLNVSAKRRGGKIGKK